MPELYTFQMFSIEADNRDRHDAVYGKLQRLEERTNTLFEDINKMEKGLNFVNEEVAGLKVTLEEKADRRTMAELVKKIDDLENRSK